MSVKAIPEGYHSVTPYLIVDGAAEAIRFYERAFGATEMLRLPMGDSGKLAHAEIKVGDSIIMLADEFPERDIRGPKSRGGCTSSLMVYLHDVDSAFQRAIDAGGRVDRAVEDQFYGDRSGTFIDPFGHKWTLSTHVEDVPEDEMQRRMAAFSEGETEPA